MAHIPDDYFLNWLILNSIYIAYNRLNVLFYNIFTILSVRLN